MQDGCEIVLKQSPSDLIIYSENRVTVVDGTSGVNGNLYLRLKGNLQDGFNS